ncbi:hypothetical protein BE04_18605 [Sorangium cellulosum]|uniref:Uncharacterized protein n=2 Tax=Sorangium cellulosum TaxID=56 RepID=A0A150P8K8_SORCE|nr:hypothetical protein [Sorangium cellulosum]AGP41060.1 hypothetical protein SCE1572_45130 [Sorangium cellulosum So0157-2]KYF51970.1 hypothetical protein BE04_18605 [Sorangium cellulosum]
MNQQIGTLGFVFKYRIRSRSYHDKRCFLRAKAWAMAAAAMSARFYCDFLTFPGWKSPDGMMDFARVWGRFPLTDDSALCVQINASPIDDGIGDSVFQLLPEPLWQQLRADFIGIERLEDLPVSDRPRSLRTALDTPLARLLEGFALDPDLESCALIYGDVNDATDALSCDPSRLVAAFLLHTALLGDEPLLALSARRGG